MVGVFAWKEEEEEKVGVGESQQHTEGKSRRRGSMGASSGSVENIFS